MAKRSSDGPDTDHTDELPILLDTVALDERDEPVFAEPRRDDTAEHLVYPAADAGGAADKLAELTARAEQVPALEAQIRVLTESARDLEQRIAEKDQRLDELIERLAALQRTRHDEAAAEHQRLRGAAEAAQRDADASRRELAAKPALAAAAANVEELRENYATLASYVAGRRSWWDDLQATSTRLAARVATLEHELKDGAKRVAAAEAFANRESDRAVALRAELVDYARRVDALERELTLARALEAPPARDGGPAPSPADLATLSQGAAASSSPQAPPVLTEAVDAVAPAADLVAPAVEAIAQLEGEVEYKRQQVAAQLVELRDREQRLRLATGEISALRAELDDSLSSVARLEQTVADKDRALEVRDARIATLHEEIQRRLSGVAERSAVEFSLPPIDAAASSRPSAHDPVETTSAPILICLTGDAPRRFTLTKKTITVGRGPQCDLQILTHFVSREHARLTFNAGATVIEDLGSRNGVFVNSVRVERRPLQQGDLVTIGETQFRFVESMAH